MVAEIKILRQTNVVTKANKKIREMKIGYIEQFENVLRAVGEKERQGKMIDYGYVCRSCRSKEEQMNTEENDQCCCIYKSNDI